MASSCASDIRSVTGAMVASSSLGISVQPRARSSTGSVIAAVISAGRPQTCHARERSAKNSSLSLLREPCGRPLGLPDWPGFQGINPRCLCFRTVESLPAASAFDIAKSDPLRGSFECTAEPVRMIGRIQPHPAHRSHMVPSRQTLEWFVSTPDCAAAHLKAPWPLLPQPLLPKSRRHPLQRTSRRISTILPGPQSGSQMDWGKLSTFMVPGPHQAAFVQSSFRAARDCRPDWQRGSLRAPGRGHRVSHSSLHWACSQCCPPLSRYGRIRLSAASGPPQHSQAVEKEPLPPF